MDELPFDVSPDQRLIAEMQMSGVIDIRPEARDIEKVHFNKYGDPGKTPDNPLQFLVFESNPLQLGLQYKGTSFRLYLKK